MSRHDQRVGPRPPGDDAERVDGARQAAAVVAVDHREGDRAEHVAHDHHVGVPEVDDAVAVRVRGRHGEDVHLLAVQVDGDVLAVGDGRQGHRRHRLGQPQPHAVLRHDEDAHAAEVLVAAHVVPVHVGVDDEADVAVGDPANRLQDAVGERGELIVHHEDAVVAHREADVAAAAGDVVHRPAHVMRRDLHRVPVHLLLGSGRGDGEQNRRDAHQQPQPRQRRACLHCEAPPLHPPRPATTGTAG